MSASAEAIITAGLRPDLFSETGLISGSRTLVVTALIALVLVGLGFRVSSLSTEGFAEDELNKLNAVADYRAHGLTGANGEHPMLMKSLQAASIIAAEKWNASFASNPTSELYIQPEAALRFPSAALGSLTAILIYLVAAELFGPEVALVAAALWIFDPNAIGLNRIAKEDTFLLFFFLLANVFWLRGQRHAESQDKDPRVYYWATAAAYGAMMASKYVPHLIAISISYYWMFQSLPQTRWRLGKKRMLMVLGIMAAVFLVLSPTILLPETWHQMGLFAGQKLIGHDSYEFMGKLYTHRWSDWLNGVPWYFYLVLTWVKLPLLTLFAAIVGFPILFRRRLGDGRYFILFWLFFFFLGFSVLGGKFTRYYTVGLPAILITAAVGVKAASSWLTQRVRWFRERNGSQAYVHAIVAMVVIASSFLAAVIAAPYFRLYVNTLGGDGARAGFYFPHDEFYDTSIREAMADIAGRAGQAARVASETPSLAAYYAGKANRPDLACVSLSDPEAVETLAEGDFVIAARGRHYFSNGRVLQVLYASGSPDFRLAAGSVPSADVFRLSEAMLQGIKQTAR